MMAAMSTLEIDPVPCLKDNYAYLVYDRAEGVCAVVDASEAEPVKRALEGRGLKLTHILSTHHHWDHIGGNLALKEAFGVQIVGAAKDAARIPGIDIGLNEGDVFKLGSHAAEVLEIPAHTSQHIAFWFEADKAVFTGDTLFAMGCGRLFEGSPEQMHHSLGRLAGLPADFQLYCAHEYTLANAKFAAHAFPANEAIGERLDQIVAARAAGERTVPTSVAAERATNPFLLARDVQHFADLRAEKDVFRSA